MLKVALLGAGGITSVHIPGWDKVENAHIVAVCDVRRDFAEKAALPLQAQVYTDVETMLQEVKPDILDVCTPSYLHYAHCVLALEQGVHVLCEKPVCFSCDQVETLYQLADKHKVKFMVAHVIRFWSEYLQLRKLVHDGTYGRVLAGDFYRLSALPVWSWENWMMDKEKSGHVPYDLHIHDLDFLVYTFGNPASVTFHRSQSERSDYLRAVYEYPGFSIHASASWFEGDYPFKSGFRVQLERAVVELEQGILTAYLSNGEKVSLNATPSESGEKTGINITACNAYDEEIKYFAACVSENKPIEKVTKTDLETVLHILEQGCSTQIP